MLIVHILVRAAIIIAMDFSERERERERES